MSTVTFDTLELVQKLIQCGIGQKQAEAIVKAIADAQKELCTQRDLTELEHRLVIKIGALCAASIATATAIVAWLSERV